MRHLSAKAATVAALLALTLLLPLTASAHERRQVGKYDMIVGWSTEPSYVNQMNGLDLRVEDRETKELVTGLEKTLKAEVLFGAQRKPLELAVTSGSTPGRYISHMVATAPGDYRFRIYGSVQGVDVDQTFDSADGKFDKMNSLEVLQFPPVTSSADPSAQQGGGTALQRAQAAEAAAANSQTMSMAALAVGGLGLLLGVVGMVSGRAKS